MGSFEPNGSKFAARAGHVTFDARVDAIPKSQISDQLVLVLRAWDKTLKAIVDAKTVSDQAWQEARKANPESIVRITGTVDMPGGMNEQKTESGAMFNYPLLVTEITLLSEASADLPRFKRGLTDDATYDAAVGAAALTLTERLNNRVLDVRNAATGAVFKLQSGISQLIVEFMGINGFQWIHTPRIVSTAIEGDNEFFSLPYFGRDAWLAQSPQHHKQMAIAMDMGRVFELGPLFRAESRVSNRHLTEFTALDLEMTFRDHYHEVLDMIESLIVFIVKGLQERKQYKDLTEVAKRLYPSAGSFHLGLDEHGKIPRITFTQAKNILRQELGFDTAEEENFTAEEEAALGRYFRTSQTSGQTDVFTIDEFPAHLRPFYSHPHPTRPGFAHAFDIVLRGREISSGSQRIHSHSQLCEAMRARDPPLDPEAEKWRAYLGAFKAGMPPHGGCGIGVNRLLQGFLGLDDVREATLFPRDAERLAP